MSTAKFAEDVRTQLDDKSGAVKHALLVIGGTALMLVMFIGAFMAMMLTAKSAYAGPVTANMERVQIEARVQALLTAYAADNQDAVLRLVDTRAFSFYGSDISEFAHTAAELKQMMTDDFKLWHTARFGKIRNLDIRMSRDLASAFFNVPFSADGGSDVMVRLTTVWRKVHGVWLLTQSANSVPTTGSSARKLLQHMPAASQNPGRESETAHLII